MCIFFKFFTVTQIYYTCYSDVVLLVGAFGYIYVHYLFATSAGNLKMVVSVSLTDASQANESKKLVRVCSVKATVPVTAKTVHTELLECNPQYAQMLESIVSKPRWLRPREELLTTHRSSLVFATTDEEAAKLMLKSRSLAAFSRHCFVRAFQDRPPITQYKNCWRLDHLTHKCKEDQRCRIVQWPPQREKPPTQ